MSIKSSSLITDGLPLDDTKPSSVKTGPDRTADQGVGGQTARTRVTGSSPLQGSSPITRVTNLQASRLTYRIRWPSTSIIGWLRASERSVETRAFWRRQGGP